MSAETLLKNARTVAVVGASSKSHRASYDIVRYLKEHGYTVWPVNPRETEILGLKVYPDLASLPSAPDIVDIFRKSEDIPPVVDEAVAAGAKAVWMQLGLTSEAGAETARAAGLEVVMDKCIKVEHAKLG